MNEAPAIIGTCINCFAAHGSLSATVALIVLGASIALSAVRKKLVRVRLNNRRSK